jgi:isopropylmalate/homocitrate/citramalate synthase
MFANLPGRVRIVEVGPRDGLQNEPNIVPTHVKARYVEMLAASGLTNIEVSSFVNPKRVPQLADADELFGQLTPRENVSYSALVPNRRGLERALAAGVREIALFTAASETFVHRNIGMTISESLAVFRDLMPDARAAGSRVRAYISTAFYCPFEGRISAEAVQRIVAELMAIGVNEISLGDTIGHAVPTDVAELLETVSPTLPLECTACHFHDTRGAALANVLTALEFGVAVFDTASGGLGGCPFAPGAAGNLATEDLILMLNGMNIETGVDVDLVADASRYLSAELGKPLPGKALQAMT